MTTPKSEELAALLREHPPKLDELSRARLEQRLLAAARSRHPSRKLASRKLALGAGALAIAAAVAIIWLLPEAERPPVAHFERRLAASLERGTLEEGSSLRTAANEVAQIRLESAQLHVAAESHVRIARLARAALAFELDEGTLEVEFHPRERGRERLTVETPAARVEVVGTVFRVDVREGATEVAVSEGAVRVVPNDGRRARLLRAGEEVRVEPNRSAPDPAEKAAASVHAEAARPDAPLSDPPIAPPPPLREVRGDDTPAPSHAAAPSAPISERSAPERPPSPSERLEEARTLIASGRSAAALRLLRTLTRSAMPAEVRVEAWMLVADAHLSSNQLSAAADAYERAAREGHGSAGGHNAIYALARLEHRRIGDLERARASYERYLRAAPDGALAGAARSALCSLGVSVHCDVQPEVEP